MSKFEASPSNTSVGRLLQVVEDVQAVEQSLPFREVWAKALGYRSGQPAEPSAMAEVTGLLGTYIDDATNLAVSSTDFDLAAFLDPLPSWADGIYGYGKNLSVVQTYTGREIFSDQARHALTSQKHLFQQLKPEATFKEEERLDLLHELNSALTTLMADLRASDLPSASRVRVADSIGRAIATISWIRYRGDEAVLRSLGSVDANLGGALSIENSSGKPDKTRIHFLQGYADVVSDLVTKATRAAALPVTFGYVLQGGDLWTATVGLSLVQAGGSETLKLLSGKVKELTTGNGEVS